jgi:hypothetical protein
VEDKDRRAVHAHASVLHKTTATAVAAPGAACIRIAACDARYGASSALLVTHAFLPLPSLISAIAQEGPTQLSASRLAHVLRPRMAQRMTLTACPPQAPPLSYRSGTAGACDDMSASELPNLDQTRRRHGRQQSLSLYD